MEEDEGNPFKAAQTVDPEVRAYVYSLVTALGGTGADEDGRYVLGDDALACLRDLKRWLKLYDEKTNRLDVARCLAEANLVNGDLLPILALWDADEVNDRTKARIALGVLELLVPLTWPLETGSALTANHQRHTPYLQQAQVRYKAGVLGHDAASILRSVVRIGLPSIAVPRNERTTRDEGIIKLMLYFLRNIAAISSVPNIPTDGLENEISRSATIERFRFEDVFAVILTICSNMGEDFDQQDVIVLDTLFHLIKGVNVETLFMSEEQQKVQKTSELKDILSKETSMQRDYARTAPTRHGRFGTMIWVKRDDEKMSAVSGQENLKDSQHTLSKMDKSKKFDKPRSRMKDEQYSIYDFDKPVRLTRDASEDLRMFAEEFLDSGFNPLFTHLRKAIERESDRILEVNIRQYFYVVAWFLRAERARRDRQKRTREKSRLNTDFEVDSYGLVAGVLNQETFVLLNRVMQKSSDNKEWQDLNATMRCFTEILLTVQEMALSPLEEDQDIAENIQNRIFYEESTHDRIITLLKNYKDQGFGYLDACTELSHVFLRLLERYSKENVDLQIRSRRRARRKKREQKQAEADNGTVDDDERSEDEDIVDAAQVSRERKFDFGRFSAKFVSQKSVDTFVALISYYRDLSVEQIKRAHRFFYRVAFKQDMAVLLYRMDIVALFYKMVKGPEGLNPSNKMHKELEEFSRQLFKKMFKKIAERPELVTELLFSKINATLYYLEFGHEKQTSRSSMTTTELEVKGSNRTLDEKIAIVVAALNSSRKIEFVSWVARNLELAISKRKSWTERLAQRAGSQAEKDGDQANISSSEEAPPFSIKPRNDADMHEVNRNAKLRLLMTLVGMQKPVEEDTMTWMIPPTVSNSQLEESSLILNRHLETPQTEINGIQPSDLLRRVTSTTSDDTNYEGDALPGFIASDSEGTDAEEAFLFPDNIRQANPHANALEDLKKRRLVRKRKRRGSSASVDEALVEERRKAREAAALARRRAIKSDLYVHDSDDESDEEANRLFFEQEAKRREQQASNVLKALASGQQNIDPKKRKASRTDHDPRTAKKSKKAAAAANSASENDDSDSAPSTADDEIHPSDSDHHARGALMKSTPISSPQQQPLLEADDSDDDAVFLAGRKTQGKNISGGATAPVVADVVMSGDKAAELSSVPVVWRDEDDEDPIISTATAPRRRVRAGFIVDSDDDE